MRWVVVLVVVVACGRIGFDPLHDDGGDGSDASGDGSVAGPRCTVPARPDVSNPRITLGCDQIIAAQEVLNGGVIRFDCATGVLLGSPILVNQDTIIDGHDVVFDGQGITSLFRVVNNAHLTLLDVTVTRGAVADYGAGIRLDSGGLVAFDSTFSDNHGPAADVAFGGGAIATLQSQATVEIYGGTFSNNTSANAGAIQIFSDLTLVNTRFDSNTATGPAGVGGDGGAVYLNGSGDVVLCGDTFTSNVAGNDGGAIDVISSDHLGTAKLTDVVIDFNRANGAGGAYLQALASLTMRRVSVTNNAATAGGGGGLWFEGPTAFDGENVSIVANRADGGTGAGMYVGSLNGSALVRFSFSTIADNLGNCPSCGASAIANALDLDLVNTIIVDNTSQGSQMACSQTGTSGAATWQWPGDPPPCVPNVTVMDPLLLPRANATGPVGTLLVRRPSSGSPVLGVAATGCPAEDILGNPRPTPCSAGSVEP